MLIEHMDVLINVPIMFGIGLALPIALTAGQTLFQTLANRARPKTDFSKLRLPEGDIRAAASARAGTEKALTQSNIRRAGAARRLPAGAILSNIAGTNINSNRVDPATEAAILNVRRHNVGVAAAEEQEKQQRSGELFGTLLGGLGGLGRIALLHQAGLLDNPAANAAVPDTSTPRLDETTFQDLLLRDFDPLRGPLGPAFSPTVGSPGRSRGSV